MQWGCYSITPGKQENKWKYTQSYFFSNLFRVWILVFHFSHITHIRILIIVYTVSGKFTKERNVMFQCLYGLTLIYWTYFDLDKYRVQYIHIQWIRVKWIPTCCWYPVEPYLLEAILFLYFAELLIHMGIYIYKYAQQSQCYRRF